MIDDLLLCIFIEFCGGKRSAPRMNKPFIGDYWNCVDKPERKILLLVCMQDTIKALPKFRIPKNLPLIFALLPTVALLATISLVYLYLGLTVDANFLGASQAFSGFTLLVVSVAIPQVGRLALRRFAAYHAVFFVGAMLVLDFLKTGVPFTSVNSFEMGSFALIVTGLFISKAEDPYRTILFYSISATVLFFLSGTFLAFIEVASTVSNPIPANPNIVHAISSMFLLGVTDLLTLSLQFYIILYRKQLKTSKSSQHQHADITEIHSITIRPQIIPVRRSSLTSLSS